MKAVKMQNEVHHREKKIHNNNVNSNNSNYINQLGCFDVAELMKSFLGGFLIAGDILKKHTIRVLCYMLGCRLWGHTESDTTEAT